MPDAVQLPGLLPVEHEPLVVDMDAVIAAYVSVNVLVTVHDPLAVPCVGVAESVTVH